MNLLIRKTCGICATERDAGRFYKDRSSKDGLFGYCKDCSRVKTREWYIANRVDRPRKNARISKSGMPLGKNKNVKWRRYMEDKCRRCGFTPEDICQLTVDHIDRNKKNNDPSNLQTLCANCHNYKTKIECTGPEKLLLLNLKPSTP